MLKTGPRVLLLPLHRYIDSNWGSEYGWAINIAKGVAAQGFNYTAVIGETDKETRTVIESTGNEVVEFGVGREWDMRSDLTFYTKLFYQGMKLVAKNKPHVLHHVFPMGYRAGFNPLILAGSGVPSVIGPLALPSFDGDDEPQLLRYLGVWSERSKVRSYPISFTSILYRQTLLKASHILFDSEETRTLISKFEPRLRNKRYTVLPGGGVDPLFRYTRRKPGQGNGFLTLGTLSRMRRKKHLDTLIRAVSLVKNRQVRLMVGGDGAIKSKLSQLAVEVGVSDRVIFLGKVPRATAPEYLSEIDVLCSLDKIPHETMPSVQEAMTCGTPIIASARRTPPRVRELPYGFIADAESPEQVASAIEHFANNPDSVAEKGRTARDFAVENFSLESVGRKIKDAYVSCMNYA